MKKTLITFAAVMVLAATAAGAPFGGMEAQAAEQTAVMNAELLDSINELRSSEGLPALVLDAELSSIADVRSEEIAQNWSHTRPNGTEGCEMIAGNKWKGENLSYINYKSFDFSDSLQASAAGHVFASLEASPSHYSNMVNENFTKIGISTSVTDTANGVKLSTAYMFSN